MKASHWFGGGEAQCRRALLEAIIGEPSGDLPPMSGVDLEGFWARFEDAAPIHLRLGMGLGVFVVGVVVPQWLGYDLPLQQLGAKERDTVVQRAVDMPIAGDLIEIVKVVACMAYFDDPSVQRSVRGVSP